MPFNDNTTIDTDLQQFLYWTSNGAVVEQGKVSENYTTSPAIYFNRINSDVELFLGGEAGLYDSNYDVEVYGEDIDKVEDMAQALISALHGFMGKMGYTTVQAAFVTDHSEDYASKVAMETDEGINVSHFALQIIH